MTKRTALSSLILFSALLSGSCARVAATHADAAPEPPRTQLPVTVQQNPAFGKSGALSIADVAERALPSVVNIALTKQVQGPGPEMQFPFPFFFGPPQERGERRQHGLGSGVIVSADGYVLTNNHVVEGASEIKVTTSDKREFDAQVVGNDPKSDLAVIKLNGNVTGLKPIEFGDSSKLRLGDVVVAIGNPFGIGQTVTMGIVSAKGRADMGIVDYEDFIQTDAAINPGNSGGALINMEGQLVGVNTAIYSRSGGYQGIGFSIPSNMAVPIWESLKKNGRVVRGWLGVGIQDVDADLASGLKLPSSRGVLISDVRPGGPAARAGLRRGDLITKIDGRPVASSGEFRNLVAASGASRSVNLEMYREGKLQTLPVMLGEMPNDTENSAAAPSGSGPSASAALSGLVLEPLNAENRRAFGLPPQVQQGVVITQIAPGSSAARAGLRPGDVVLEVSGVTIDSLQKFQDAFAKAKGSPVLLVQRGGSTVYVPVRR
ncbi:MAG TPA: DegQ family serine endoprotease [Polyangiaceae bacterium]|nr:DegQ family serine endoprotease [Polyangiaceae bacterium]